MTKARQNADNFAADITGVTAGTGITGGGTSGAVTVTNSLLTTIDAAGDLLYGTGNDAAARLAIGTATQVLAVNSGATAPEWIAAPAVGGMTLIAATATNGLSNVVFSSIPATFKHLLLVFDEIRNNASANQLQIRLNNATTDYIGYDLKRAEPSTFTQSAFSGTNLNNGRTDLTTTTGSKLGGQVWVYDYASTTQRKVYDGFTRGYSVNFSGEAANKFGGYFNSISAVTSLEFRGQSLLANDGEVRLYGVS